jgi:exodeoxyribonuclease V alpha subunit
MEELSGLVDHLTYHDEESFFTVAHLLLPSQKKPIIITGTLPAIQVGETIHCEGCWKKHAKHGMQFEVESYRLELPNDARSIEKFLAAGALKGIGPVYAAKIVERFGKDTLRIIEQQPELLETVEGLGLKRIKGIESAWKEHKSLQELLLFLHSFDISRAYARKILRAYGNYAIQKIKQAPYQLAKDVAGIGFILADKIASHLGHKKDSESRIEAGIDYVLYECAQEGHVCYPLEALVDRAEKTLEVSKQQIQSAIGHLAERGDIELRRKDSANAHSELFVWSRPLFLSECGIANEIKRLQNAVSATRQVDVDKAITWAEGKLRIRFADMQKEALKKVLSSKVSIITGGPGTGKSTITSALVAILEKLTDKIILAAPTGRAAKRLFEITHKYASTIHRLLKFDFTKGKFKHDRETPLTADLVIVDESSMIDTYLMYQLLRALPDGAKVVFVGDIHQLPSIGPGNVLKDLIGSNTIPFVRLNAIFRQAAGSKIIVNAHRINEGKMPISENSSKSDFIFVEAKEAEDVKRSIIDLVSKKIPDRFGFDPKKEIQVLAPMRKGPCGIDILNKELQAILTPKETSGHFYRVGDKVMQLKNNYSKEVYNGDIGQISSIDTIDGQLRVMMDDKEVLYSFSELDELVLAYAVSIHKYQGSECPCIVLPAHTAHFKLLTKNLLYTGVTRGKKLVVVVGTKKALAIAVKNEDVQLRYTGLLEMLSHPI